MEQQYQPDLPWGIKATVGAPAVILAIFSLILASLDEKIASLMNLFGSIFSAYLFYGYKRSVRLKKSDAAFHYYARPLFEPFATQQETRIDFDSIRGVSHKQGPVSHHGPEVSGEWIVVVSTESEEFSISSRWFAAGACEAFYQDVKEVVSRNSERAESNH